MRGASLPPGQQGAWGAQAHQTSRGANQREGCDKPSAGLNGAGLVRSTMWNQLKSYLRNNQEEDLELKNIKGNKNMDRWRKNWAGKRAIEKREELAALEELEIEEESEGTFYTLRKVSMELGNDIVGALNHAKSCLQMGRSQFQLDVTDF